MYSLINGIQVTIGKFTFNQVIKCKVVKTTRLLSNTAEIELPLTAVFESNRTLSIAKEIKRGDKVSIEMGYDGKRINEFTGYVESISDDEKTVIKCEDAMFVFRKALENKMFTKTMLKEVVNYIISGSGLSLNADIPNIEFDQFLIKNATGIQALQKIKDEYGLLVYLDNEDKIYVGLSYVYNEGTTVKYNLQQNVVDNKLTYKVEDELQFKIKAISLLKNNKKLTIDVGDNEGEQRTLYFRNITDEAKLKELALQEIQKYKYTGYRGSILAFGLPFCSFGMIANIIDDNYPSREGNYYVEGVTVEFSDGFRREVELGIKL